MAIYPYKCVECGSTAEVVQSISAYCVSPIRPDCCGKTMERVITKPMVSFDFAPWASFQSPIDGSTITGRSEQREHMARHGVVLYDDIAPDIERTRKEQAAAQKAQIKQDVIEAMHKVEAGYKPQVAPAEAIIPE